MATFYIMWNAVKFVYFVIEQALFPRGNTKREIWRYKCDLIFLAQVRPMPEIKLLGQWLENKQYSIPEWKIVYWSMYHVKYVLNRWQASVQDSQGLCCQSHLHLQLCWQREHWRQDSWAAGLQTSKCHLWTSENPLLARPQLRRRSDMVESFIV